MAKVLVDFAKETPALKVKAGIVDKGFMSEVEIAAFSRLPSRNQLIAMYMAGFKSPFQKLVYTLVAYQGRSLGSRRAGPRRVRFRAAGQPRLRPAGAGRRRRPRRTRPLVHSRSFKAFRLRTSCRSCGWP